MVYPSRQLNTGDLSRGQHGRLPLSSRGARRRALPEERTDDHGYARQREGSEPCVTRGYAEKEKGNSADRPGNHGAVTTQRVGAAPEESTDYRGECAGEKNRSRDVEIKVCGAWKRVPDPPEEHEQAHKQVRDPVEQDLAPRAERFL